MVPERQRIEPSSGGLLAAVLAVFVVLGASLLQLYRADRLCDGQFTYWADEAYQNLAIARDFGTRATEGFGSGVGLGRLLSATPSVGWTLCLASLMRLPGPSASDGAGVEPGSMLPAATSVVLAAVLLLAAGHLLRREVSALGLFCWLVLIGLLTPVSLVVLAGTEHMAMTTAVLLLAAGGIDLIEHERCRFGCWCATLVMAIVAVLMGYEALLVLIGLGLWAVVRRRFGRVLLPLLAGFAVVVGLGVVLRRDGAWYAPNVWAAWWGNLSNRSGCPFGSAMYQGFLEGMISATHVVAIAMIGAAFLWARRWQAWSETKVERERIGWLFVAVFVSLVHLLVIQPTSPILGAAYLMPLSVVALAKAFAGEQMVVAVRKESVVLAVVCLLPVVLVLPRVACSIMQAPQACRETYLIERAAASFVRTYFPSGPVAANRTGLLRFDSHARIVDLSGLLDPTVAAARAMRNWDARQLAGVAAAGSPQIAMVAGSHSAVLPPKEWQYLGGWGLEEPQPTVIGASCGVCFYAVNSSIVQDARVALGLAAERKQQGVRFFLDIPRTPPATQTAPGG